MKCVAIRWSAMLACMAVGCGDLTDAVGVQGRIELTLATDYEVDGALDDVTLVAGHRQKLTVELTSKGEADIDEPDELTYRMEPNQDVEVSAVGGRGTTPPDVELLVKKPGTYKLRAVSKGKEVDSLSLTFDKPVSLQLVVKLRAPWQEAFKDVDAKEKLTVVDEGAQVAFLPIPLDKSGDRLAGRITTKASVDPADKVVSGSSINGVYEQNVWTGTGKIEFYFIDPGRVTVTVTDSVSKAEGTHAFDVQNVGE